MSDHHQAHGPDKRAAERLLDGADGHARLHALLTAAAAPARPGELAGEDAAVAAFNAAPRPARRSRAAALRRFLTIKALTIVGGSLILTGGGAYATITGQFPGQDPAPAHSPAPDGHHGSGGDATPATRAPSSRPTSTGAHKPSPSASKKHGKSGAPGEKKKPKETKKPKERKTKPPKSTPEPSRPSGGNGDPYGGGGLGGGSTPGGGGTGGGSGTPAAADPDPGNGNGGTD